MLDSAIRGKKRHYPQALPKECKYKLTRNKVKNLINDDWNSSSSDESDIEFDNGLTMDLTMMELMINLLKVKTVFS